MSAKLRQIRDKNTIPTWNNPKSPQILHKLRQIRDHLCYSNVKLSDCPWKYFTNWDASVTKIQFLRFELQLLHSQHSYVILYTGQVQFEGKTLLVICLWQWPPACDHDAKICRDGHLFSKSRYWFPSTTLSCTERLMLPKLWATFLGRVW